MPESVFKATIVSIGNVEKVSEKFSKRVVVVDTGEKYGNFIPIEWTGKLLDTPDSFTEGDMMDFRVSFGGNKWKDRIFLSCKGIGAKFAGKGEKIDFSTPKNSDDLPF